MARSSHRRILPFSMLDLPITGEVEKLILTEPFKQRTDLKDNLANYRLNSSPLRIQPVSVWPGKPAFKDAWEGVLPRIAS